MLCVSIRPRAGEATVFTHVQLLPALPVSVAGRLPVYFGKMSFKGAALSESFPTGSTAERPYSRVRPHVALEIEGIMEALAAAVAHVAPCWAVALEVPSQHALQREGLGAKRAAKCTRGPGSRGQGSL